MIDKLGKDSIILIAIGLGILVGAYFYPSPAVVGAGFGVLAPGVVRLARYYYYRTPAHLPEYEAQQRAFSINMKDERKVFLRARAGQIAYQILFLTLLLLGAVGSLFKVNPWFCLTFLLLALFAYLCGAIAFYFLSRKL